MASFGTAALRTFAHGLASLTGNDVNVEIGGNEAYTDGTTVVLPGGGVWEREDFQALCGVTCHELAHVWFRSTAQLRAPPTCGGDPRWAGQRHTWRPARQPVGSPRGRPSAASPCCSPTGSRTPPRRRFKK
jgi:hypothetical protein